MPSKVAPQDRPTFDQVQTKATAFGAALGLTTDNTPGQTREAPADPSVAPLAIPAGAYTVAGEAPAPSSSAAPVQPAATPAGSPDNGWLNGLVALAGQPGTFGQWVSGDSKAAGAVRDMVKLDWFGAAMYRSFTDPVFEYDPSYALPTYGSDAFKALAHDIPEEYLDRFAGAQNGQHAQFIADRIREELAAEQRIADSGGPGVAARIVVNLADPVLSLIHI